MTKNIYKDLTNINIDIEKPNFWKNKKEAEKIKVRKFLNDLIENYEIAEKDLREISEFYKLAHEEK